MRIRWRNFELPSRVEVDTETLTDGYGCFTVEPFERGYGTTIGNGIRRVLVSSIEGTAVTSVKIKGVQHEFSTIKGVMEDVTDIILNLKNLKVKLEKDGPVTLKIDEKAKKEVSAGDIQCEEGCEILNPDLHIATITAESGHFKAELEVRKGRGYVTAEENEKEDMPVGRIALDSIFSPVRRVRFRTENTRVGKMTNYDRLILEVWTNGTVSPEMALVEACKIYRKHLNPFIQYFEAGDEVLVESPKGEPEQKESPVLDEIKSKLDMPVTKLELSVRASNCLEAENIMTIRDLCQRTEADMLNVRNFGKTSLIEVKKKLADMNLSLGMDLDSLLSEKGAE